tara:strand:- start:651 stop:1073 length:423 start_codon:yes stop_codon:yes gene_type:complete
MAKKKLKKFSNKTTRTVLERVKESADKASGNIALTPARRGVRNQSVVPAGIEDARTAISGLNSAKSIEAGKYIMAQIMLLRSRLTARDVLRMLKRDSDISPTEIDVEDVITFVERSGVPVKRDATPQKSRKTSSMGRGAY